MTGHARIRSQPAGATSGGVLHLFLLFVLVLALFGCAPRFTSPLSSRNQGIYHVIRPGENLYRIGKAYGVDHRELARVNRIRDAGQVRAGQTIFIPGATRNLPVEMITPEEPDPFQPPAAAPPAPPHATDQDSRRSFIWPISGSINSAFGPRGSSFHDGIDIAAQEGTPIRAIESGEVIYSDQLRGYGNIVILRHADGFVSVYAHNQINLVREGQRVARGEIVARVGSTGRVTGPHLHFEIRRNNSAQDPLRYLPQLCCDGASDRVIPGG